MPVIISRIGIIYCGWFRFDSIRAYRPRYDSDPIIVGSLLGSWMPFIRLSMVCCHAVSQHIDAIIWPRWPCCASVRMLWQRRCLSCSIWHDPHYADSGSAPAVVILAELRHYHVQWTDRSRVPKWLRRFGPWSLWSFLKVWSDQGPKWVTKNRSGCYSWISIIARVISISFANCSKNATFESKLYYLL